MVPAEPMIRALVDEHSTDFTDAMARPGASHLRNLRMVPAEPGHRSLTNRLPAGNWS
jgi:hypothetical protein